MVPARIPTPRADAAGDGASRLTEPTPRGRAAWPVVATRHRISDVSGGSGIATAAAPPNHTIAPDHTAPPTHAAPIAQTVPTARIADPLPRGRAAAAALGVRPLLHRPEEAAGHGGDRDGNDAGSGDAGGSNGHDGGAQGGSPVTGPEGPPATGTPGPGDGPAQALRAGELGAGELGAGEPGAGEGDAPRHVVAAYWRAMNANDWTAAARLFADDYVCRWPQSQEIIRGGDTWAVVQANFPTPSPWRFAVLRSVAEGTTVVSEVTVANDESTWRCVQFADVVAGRIVEHTEYWPEEMAAPTWRAGWTQRVPRSW